MFLNCLLDHISSNIPYKYKFKCKFSIVVLLVVIMTEVKCFIFGDVDIFGHFNHHQQNVMQTLTYKTGKHESLSQEHKMLVGIWAFCFKGTFP